MTDKELKTLKDNLWHAADVLRSGAHLAANKYGQPIPSQTECRVWIVEQGSEENGNLEPRGYQIAFLGEMIHE